MSWDMSSPCTTSHHSGPPHQQVKSAPWSQINAKRRRSEAGTANGSEGDEWRLKTLHNVPLEFGRGSLRNAAKLCREPDWNWVRGNGVRPFPPTLPSNPLIG